MRTAFLTLILAMTLISTGCQTTHPAAKSDSVSDAVAALGTVTEGLTNQNISKSDLKNLAVSVQKDPKTKSAVQSINDALKVQQTGVKYCPTDGQRFDSSVDVCPIHHVKLKVVE